jgi:hypothetical protein
MDWQRHANHSITGGGTIGYRFSVTLNGGWSLLFGVWPTQEP